MPRRSSKAREEKRDQLVRELETLLDAMDTMLEGYRLRVGGRVSEMLHTLHGEPALGRPPQPFTIRTTDEMLARIHAVELKPGKGRPKDFARLQQLLSELEEIAPPEP